jgi:hypothetical protein
MTLEEAKKILNTDVQSNGSLYCLGRYLEFNPKFPETATLDADFTADELEAIAVYMRANS